MTATQLYDLAMQGICAGAVVMTPAGYPARVTVVAIERGQPFAIVRYFIGENAGEEIDLPAHLLTPTVAIRSTS